MSISDIFEKLFGLFRDKPQSKIDYDIAATAGIGGSESHAPPASSQGAEHASSASALNDSRQLPDHAAPAAQEHSALGSIGVDPTYGGFPVGGAEGKTYDGFPIAGTDDPTYSGFPEGSSYPINASGVSDGQGDGVVAVNFDKDESGNNTGGWADTSEKPQDPSMGAVASGSDSHNTDPLSVKDPDPS